MGVINITNARKNLYSLVETVNLNSEGMTIVNNKGKNAVLIGEDDYNGLMETIYLNSIPGLAESIIQSRQDNLSEGIVYNEDEEW